MTPSNYQNAVELNNEGVSCLEDGSFNVAHAYFKRALDTMTDVITLHGEVVCVDEEESTVKFLWSDNPRCALHETPHQFGLSFLYSRALYISAPKQREKPEGNDESAAIVYNLGLSFHLIGNEDGSKSLATAMKFYEIASAIRSRKAATKIGILDLAILNNVGQICMEGFNFGAARQFFDQLSVGLILLNHSGRLSSFLEQNDCDGFLLNVLLEEPSLAPAA